MEGAAVSHPHRYTRAEGHGGGTEKNMYNKKNKEGSRRERGIEINLNEFKHGTSTLRGGNEPQTNVTRIPLFK